jgi:hypothetical protein
VEHICGSSRRLSAVIVTIWRLNDASVHGLDNGFVAISPSHGAAVRNEVIRKRTADSILTIQPHKSITFLSPTQRTMSLTSLSLYKSGTSDMDDRTRSTWYKPSFRVPYVNWPWEVPILFFNIKNYDTESGNIYFRVFAFFLGLFDDTFGYSEHIASNDRMSSE